MTVATRDSVAVTVAVRSVARADQGHQQQSTEPAAKRQQVVRRFLAPLVNERQTTLIRSARLDDADAILHLAQCFATSFAVESPAFHSSLPSLLVDSSACLRVAVVDGTVSGYVLGFEHLTFFASGRVAWVEEIMVAESLRQRGVGRQLMDAFTEWARLRQCRLIALATRRAAPFYQALGYEESAAYFRKLL